MARFHDVAWFGDMVAHENAAAISDVAPCHDAARFHDTAVVSDAAPCDDTVWRRGGQ